MQTNKPILAIHAANEFISVTINGFDYFYEINRKRLWCIDMQSFARYNHLTENEQRQLIDCLQDNNKIHSVIKCIK